MGLELLRFVVLEHDHPERHWDLMFEHGDVLKTWRLMEYPPRPGRDVAAVALNDHRKAYLDYEGSVSGGRGRVVRVHEGTYEIVQGDWMSEKIDLLMEGKGFQYAAVLEHIADDAWRFRKS